MSTTSDPANNTTTTVLITVSAEGVAEATTTTKTCTRDCDEVIIYVDVYSCVERGKLFLDVMHLY